MPILLRVLMLLLMVPAAALLAVAAHEVGHAVGGRLGGLRLVVLTAGPLRLERKPDGRLAARLNRHAATWGGLAISAPHRAEGLRRSALGFIVGGPVSSLVLGLVALALFVGMGLGGLEWDRDGIEKAFAAALFTFGASSLAIAAGTAVPYHMKGIASDGRRTLLLARPGPVAERHAALITLGAWSADGQAPREWDPRVVERSLATGDDGSYDAAMARYLAYLHALDGECPDAARAHVDSLLRDEPSSPAIFRPLIQAEAAYFAAAYDGDAAAARARLDGAGNSPLLDGATRRRAEAAVLLAGEDAERGRAVCAEFARGGGAGTFHVQELLRLCRRRDFPDPVVIPDVTI